MTTIESAWGKYPDYVINLVPCTATARVWHGDVLLAESVACLRLEETRHVDRLYFPESDVNWEHFERTATTRSARSRAKPTTGRSPRATQPEKNVVWTYREPFDEVGGDPGLRRLLPRERADRARRGVARRGTAARSRRTGSRRGATPATCSGSSTSSRPDRTTSSARVPRHDAQRRRRRADARAGDRRRGQDHSGPACHVGVHDLLQVGRVRLHARPRRRRAPPRAARSRRSRCRSARTTSCAAPACCSSTPERTT